MMPYQDVGADKGTLLPLLQHNILFKRHMPNICGKGRITGAPTGHHVCPAIVELVAAVPVNAQDYLMLLVCLWVCVLGVGGDQESQSIVLCVRPHRVVVAELQAARAFVHDCCPKQP
jgi:hypothetical protein